MTLLIIFCAKYLVAVPVLALAAFFFVGVKRRRHRLLWLTVVAMPLAYMISRIAGHLYYNPRPFVVSHVAPLIAHAADNGFPSDHTLIAATIAGIVFYFNRAWGSALWVVALLIGTARVFAGVHHAVDVLGAVVISIAAVIIAHYVLYYLRRERVTYISE